MSSTFWLEQLEAAKAQLALLNQAISAFASDGARQTVSLDTGQTRMSWTRAELGSLRRARESLLVEIEVLMTKTGCQRGGFVGRPGY